MPRAVHPERRADLCNAERHEGLCRPLRRKGHAAGSRGVYCAPGNCKFGHTPGKTLIRNALFWHRIIERINFQKLYDNVMTSRKFLRILFDIDKYGGAVPCHITHLQIRHCRLHTATLITLTNLNSFPPSQVVNLCWAQGLYDAILYIYNTGMADYARPLEELLAVLRQAVSTGKQLSDTQIKLGNKLLVYIR